MSTSTHLITIQFDLDVDDAFSSTHSPDYILALPNYFPASPRNISSEPSEDLSKYLLASLAISPFHDDLYMKVMQAYNATSNESPILPPEALIAPPTILPPSLVFKTRESSHVTRLEHHEEQIDAIRNHLDELPLERIKHMEDKIEEVAPVARAPYKLAPSKMQELSEQLQELADRGFIRPNTSPGELLSYLLKRKTDLSECVSITES
nr:putative reverse transcriptase domain-containing protein [Tanacetum cinerariifolium]